VKYNNQVNLEKRKQFVVRARLLFLLIFIILALVASYFYYAVKWREESNTTETTTSETSNGYFAPSVKIFRSPFFQFQTDNTWSEVPAESTASKYVYRSLRAKLIEHELIIYVNQIPPTLAANRALPVNATSDARLLPISVTDHCIKATGGNSTIRDLPVTIERVKLPCDSDSTNYTVLVGLIDGTTTIPLKRSDGTTAQYAFLYSNQRATPEGGQIVEIMTSFQAR
jgi:hypothetical protein